MKHAIPQDAAKSACKHCGETVFLVETRPGKLLPLDPDGYPHFSTCQGAIQPTKLQEVPHV
jgi:hypothetical protein